MFGNRAGFGTAGIFADELDGEFGAEIPFRSGGGEGEGVVEGGFEEEGDFGEEEGEGGGVHGFSVTSRDGLEASRERCPWDEYASLMLHRKVS